MNPNTYEYINKIGEGFIVYNIHMKILFVCKWNMGRSQMAEELFNLHSSKNIGISAGTNTVPFSEQQLKDVAPLTVQVLKEKNIDISVKCPVRLTEELAQFADNIIVITDKANLPDYLKNSDKLIFWDIKDGEGKDYEFHVAMRNQLEKLVESLIKKLDN